ncbi:MAG: ParB N-terminal domain-containing protein [Planctomycetia bacterium]|nr:ParB N-terminal domain-containing protein [Planctomycetia bacterium]
MKVEMWKTSRVKPCEQNPRENSLAVKAVMKSIAEFGFQQPIVVDNLGVVIAGHTRLAAAKRLKLKEVPVVVAKDLTPVQVRAYRLIDNKTGELAIWDFEALQVELKGLDMEYDMSTFGFEPVDLDATPAPGKSVAIPEIFEVAIRCRDEEDQRTTYEAMRAAGRSCRLLNL